MRILSVSLCYPSPAAPDEGIFVQRRLTALAQRPGVEVDVLSPRPWCPVVRSCTPIPAQHHPLPAVYPPLPGLPILNWATDGWACSRAIARWVRRRRRTDGGGVDLIDAHFVYPEGVGALLAGRRLGIPVVVTVRGKIVSLARRPVRRAQIRTMLRHVDACVAVSDSLAEAVRDLAGQDVHVDVIPNGVDTSLFHPVDRAAAREALGWNPTRNYILAVGHLQRLKGFDRLVDVWSAIQQKAVGAHLVLAGSRRGERSFQRQLLAAIDAHNARDRAAGRTPSITYVGPVPAERLNLMYNAADLLANTSRQEGFCNAIAEALAAGTPIVATDVGGNRQQLHSPELGIVVPDGDPRALADGITTALQRTWDRTRIARQGSTRSWQHVSENVHRVFERVVGRRAVPIHRNRSARRIVTVPAPQAAFAEVQR